MADLAPCSPLGVVPMIELGELMMILELHRQGLSAIAIALPSH